LAHLGTGVDWSHLHTTPVSKLFKFTDGLKLRDAASTAGCQNQSSEHGEDCYKRPQPGCLPWSEQTAQAHSAVRSAQSAQAASVTRHQASTALQIGSGPRARPGTAGQTCASSNAAAPSRAAASPFSGAPVCTPQDRCTWDSEHDQNTLAFPWCA